VVWFYLVLLMVVVVIVAVLFVDRWDFGVGEVFVFVGAVMTYTISFFDWMNYVFVTKDYFNYMWLFLFAGG